MNKEEEATEEYIKDLIAWRKKQKPQKYSDNEEVIHPDMVEAYAGYTGDNDSFKRVFRNRDRAVERGETYWNEDHDEEMRETARERTDNAVCKGWKWPKVTRRK